MTLNDMTFSILSGLPSSCPHTAALVWPSTLLLEAPSFSTAAFHLTFALHNRLRATLAEALSKDTSHAVIDLDTPADMALKLIYKILCGAEVRPGKRVDKRPLVHRGV